MRGWAPAEGGAVSGSIAFAPKGLYLVGAASKNVTEGTWIRFVPDAWPETESRPTLLVGRVVSCEKTGARVEILSLSPSIPSDNVRVERYGHDGEVGKVLHSLTKRLVFGDSVGASVRRDAEEIGVISGSRAVGGEIYGAYDLSSGSGRLGSRCTALLTSVPGDAAEEWHLRRAVGSLPDYPAFVLLDAPAAPAFRVRVSWHGFEDSVSREIRAAVESMVSGLPGETFIEIGEPGGIRDRRVHEEALGGRRTDELDVRVVWDGRRGYWVDQGIRVDEAPWRAVVEDGTAREVATALVMRALSMLGHHASSAYLGERMMSQALRDTDRASLAPALAWAYHSMGRDDWALELGLEVAGMAREAGKASKGPLLSAAASVMSICGLGDEFSSLYDDAYQVSGEMSPAWRTLLAYSYLYGESRFKQERFGSLVRGLIRDASWSNEDDMRACARSLDLEDSPVLATACERGAEQAVTSFATTWFEAMPILSGESAAGNEAEMLGVADRVDWIGAPSLALRLWTEFSSRVVDGAGVPVVWHNAAQYARVSGQYRHYLLMMSELLRFLVHRGSGADLSVFSEALHGWHRLDMRESLAAYCVAHASEVPPGESVEYLRYAAELYLTLGNAVRVSEVYAAISRILEAEGQNDAAQAARRLAHEFDVFGKEVP